jgi:sugar phosphate isomerase/epimerase
VNEGTSRREFLTRSALGLAALGAPAHLFACAGAAEANDRLERIGVQLYTVRSLMEQSVEDTLRQVAAIGYKEVEFAGYFNRDAKALRATLDSWGLSAPAAHVPLEDLSSDRADRVLDDAATLGHRYLIVPWLAPEVRRTADDWKRMAQRFNSIGGAVRARGMQFAYHNHEFEFVPVDGQVPMDILLEQSDPGLVKVELDLYWITRAGASISAYFTRWPGRFPTVHVKDSAGAPQHEMRDVGSGSIPFGDIFSQRKQAGIQHFFVEHDNPPQPMETLRNSYTHLNTLTF